MIYPINILTVKKFIESANIKLMQTSSKMTLEQLIKKLSESKKQLELAISELNSQIAAVEELK